MEIQELLAKYKDIRNGQDLIDANVVPKTSSQMLTLITYRRLLGLQEIISSTLDEKLVGQWVPAVEKEGEGYRLRNGVVADATLGWKIRIKEPYKGHNWDKDTKPVDAEIPAGKLGNLRACETASTTRSLLTISFDERIGGRSVLKFRLEDIAQNLEVSSIGAIAPCDKEQMVYDQAMYEFFAKAKLDTDRTARAIVGMLMPEKDLILYGPPGSAKSTEARDVIGLLMQQGIRFEVDGCKLKSCHPASLYDKDFAKIVPPCDDCKQKHNGNRKISYKDTGIFVPPQPKDVPVKIVQFGEGHGVSYVECTRSIRRRHLAGEKIPKLDGTTDAEREDLRSLEGFNPGSVTSSHNGICHLDEINELTDDAQMSFLEVNSNHRIQPDELKCSLPVRNVMIGTTNDPAAITDKMRDRFFMLAVRYHSELDVAQKMLKGVLHGSQSSYQKVELGDMHVEDPNVLMDIVAPITLENAVVAAFYKFRGDNISSGKSEIFGSGRALIDAPLVARAELLRDRIFFAKTPKIMDMKYAISGMQFALCARVGNNNHGEDVKMKEEFRTWVEQNYPLVLKEEENKWCCDFFNKHLSVIESQVPEVKANFFQEMTQYDADPRNAIKTYSLVRQAHEEPTNIHLQEATINHPFMEYLFLDQPGMKTIKQDALVELIGYYSKAYQNSECKIDATK